MLATKYTEKALSNILKKNPYVYVQEKYDGVRVYIKDGKLYSRTNKEIYIEGSKLYEEIQNLDHNFIFDGELLVFGEGSKPLDRKTGNGIINKAIHGNATQSELDMFNLVLFDCVSNTNPEASYNIRLINLFRLVSTRNSRLKYTTTFISKDKGCIEKWYSMMVSEGKEGIMIKAPNGIYQGKRVTHVLKRKQELTADLRVVGYEKGTGKYEGMLGALICATDDGKLVVNVGTGFTDEQRDFNNVPDIDSIVEVKYNAVIGKKDSDVKSLFLPVYVGLRTDKTTTNTLEEL